MSRRVVALVLAAGLGRRMGRMKQLLPYRGRTMVDVVLETAAASDVDGVVVVTNPTVAALLAGRLSPRCAMAVNEDPQSEMLASVKIGLAEARSTFRLVDDDGLAVLLGDQPEVAVVVIDRVLETYRSAPDPQIAIATYDGRRGHPAVFPIGLLVGTAGWPVERRLSDLARLHPERVCEIAVRDVPPPIDVNSPDDYKRL